MSYSTYPIKLQLFQLMLPTAISALKGLADLCLKNEKKERKDKSPNAKEKKDSQVLVLRLGSYVIPNEQM